MPAALLVVIVVLKGKEIQKKRLFFRHPKKSLGAFQIAYLLSIKLKLFDRIGTIKGAKLMIVVVQGFYQREPKPCVQQKIMKGVN